MFPGGGGQWGQPGPGGYGGYMQQQPTGYHPQQQQQQQQQQPRPMGMQPTGYMGPQPTGFMGGPPPPQMGMQPQRGFLGPPQPTGMSPMGLRPPGGPGFMGPQPTGYGGMQPQPTGFMGPQPTGFMGAQPTGLPMDPRMQLMSAQFLPGATPFSGAPVASNMNFSSASVQPSNFQSQIQNLSQQQQGSKEPKIPWTLSKEEKKSYDSIFRAWDQQGTGFISGDVAREVFGQSGLDRDSLMQIWHLSDTENRGKLNLAEFHVAMGLIYRGLNGNDIPQELPPELVPPSSKQLNESVDFLKDLLKRDTSVRNSTALNLPEAGSNRDANYAKSRSLYQNPIERKQDATAYKHEDSAVTGGYRSSSRHLDRKAVRFGGESKEDDLSEMKRQLANTQKMLDDQDGEDDSDDREINKEMDDLRFRIRRVQDDIEYYQRRGGRDAADQRRKAERELMHLMHERLPQLEKRIEEKDRRKKDRQLDESRERDRRNEAFSRGSAYSSRYDDRERERDRDRYDDRRDDRRSEREGPGEYLRGTFERERSDRGDRDRDSTPRTRSPAPEPPAAPAAKASPAPAPPAPLSPAPSSPAVSTASTGPPKNLSASEKQAWIREQAQRRIQERMRALGAAAPASSATDSSVEDRLKADREEAEARSAQADQEARVREEARKARLEEQRLSKDKAAVTTVKAELDEQAKGADAPPAPVMEAAREQVDEQEAMIRRREEVLAKEKAEREARLKKLEEDEAEARRQEEAFKERQTMFSNKGKAELPPPSRKKAGAPPPPPPSRSRAPPAAAAAPSPPAPPSAPLAPPAPPAPPAQTSPSTNPFHRMQGGAGGAAAAPGPATPGGTNPFFRQNGGPASTPPTVNASLPAPARATPPASAQPTGASTTRSASSAAPAAARAPAPADDDWGDSDKSDDDDDDGPGTTTRATRQNLAQALFSGMVPSSGGAGSGGSGSGRSTPAPAAPAPPPAPPAPASAGNDGAAPPPPPPPAAPSAPAAPAAPAFKAPTGPADRGALLGAIQGGLKLKKAQTRDASGPPGAGKVLGDASAPVQHYSPPPSPPAAPAAPTPAADDSVSEFASNPNRQSTDWAKSLATEQMSQQKASAAPDEPSVREESEDEDEAPEDPDHPVRLDAAPNNHDSATTDSTALAVAGDTVSDAVEDFNLDVSIRVRTLYPYSGQRDEDLSFEENVILIGHPGKDAASDWMYGTLLTGGAGSKGQFPRAYVAEIGTPVTARALYDYTASSPDEASLTEGDEVHVVDQEDASWWKIDHGDAIKIVPATYLELSVSSKAANDTIARNGNLRSAIALKTELDEDGSRTPVEKTPIADRTPVARQSVEKAAIVGSPRDEPEDGSDGDDDVPTDSGESATGWTSSSEEEDDEDDDTGDTSIQEEQTPEAEAARAAERLQVLEAAGLLIREAPAASRSRRDSLLQRRKATRRASSSSQEGDGAAAPAAPVRTRTKGPRPEAPARRRPTSKKSSIPKPERELPAPPVPKPEEQMEDAYDRFLKLQRETMNAPSVATPPARVLGSPTKQARPSTPASPRPATPSSSTEQGKASGFLSSITSSLRSKAGGSSSHHATERRATPIISGPMSAPTESDAASSLPTSNSAGALASSTWSSFMDAPLLASLPDEERKRQEAIFELCQSQSSHLEQLQTIVEVFYNGISQEGGLLDEKARLVIFANIEDVLLAAVSFFSDLEERQRSSRLYVDTIGDVLVDHIPRMKVYLPYCTNQSTAAQILTTERARHPALDQLLITLRSSPAGKGLDLSAYLLTPMQRLTKLPLLISQILKYTQPDHVDYDFLQAALRTAQDILSDTNDRIRLRQNEERLRLLSQTLFLPGSGGNESARVDLTKDTRFLGPRRILREDSSLSKRKSKSGRKLTLVLCNDVLLILTGANQLYRMPAPLEEVVVRPIKSRRPAAVAAVGAGGSGSVDDGGEAAAGGFQIVMAGGSEKVEVKTTTQRAAVMWMKDIEDARSKVLSAASTPRSPPPLSKV